MREKLVRDRVPELFDIPPASIRVATDEELGASLAAKLVEEANEYLESRELEELADVLEVVSAIAQTRGLEPETLERMRAEKRSERGGFAEKLIWAIPPELDVPWVATDDEEGQ
ncbi:MAG: nucleoside triphosphate pyrophosphohydrolase [Actinomycetota bacterium]